MNRIVVLPDHLKHMIAAGEVIEAPFSVVKELVENSIDAGATEIDVQVQDAGLKRIYVKDNGSGIYRDDAPLSIKEHATSKISDISGLQSITTYGFRGEALSSICSISDFVLLTRHEGEETGARIESRNGSHSVTDYAGSRGTTIIVDNLFFNMPARKKFLKAKKTELRTIRETLLRMSLAVPHVSFSFEVDGKREITLASADGFSERVKQVFGASVYNSLYYDELSDLKVKLSGFLSRPDYMRNTRSMQMLFINGRPVEQKYLSYHLARAYEAVMPRGKYPAAILFMEIDPELIDVNIHPAKREVKLFDQKYIDSLIFSLASKVLNRAHLIPEKIIAGAAANAAGNSIFNKNTDPADITPAEYNSVPRNFRVPDTLPVHTETYSSPGFSTGKGAGSPAGSLLFDSAGEILDAVSGGLELKEHNDNFRRIIGIVFNTYILIEENEKMHFIDFHAAHERILYDKLCKGYELEIQELLFPVQIELTAADFSLVMDNLESFSSCGFEIEEFSDKSVVVRSVPAAAGNYKIEELLKNMIDNIRDEKDSNDLKDKIISSLACHSAKRSGDSLSTTDMKTLAGMVFSGEIELRCPHGRPFLFTINKNDIERMFKRL
ncbi:MAG TPA: DNA mismatch repair endonuclease MutL [Spirochaetota bacterium]|nr:DNA mismatch repair endonuclease MutL [Spirochaetota bacterium]HPF05274.1 DNA mismatch repair endonuclease MutL [Spirochaetota bacterium]HPJ40891.1 DNA mismatch repair endonuclease MutL [Spirochaetota bacterium]HRX46550.1 DNA mismatch repair endonuclease MutL [Spirochaetota bacterium]